MSRLHLRRPSPGLVLAAVALFVALGGGAYAATSDFKTDKKIAKKAAKNYFNGHIGSASVSHATDATSATNATKLGGQPPSDYQTASNYMQSSTAKAINATDATIGSPIQVTTTGTKRVIASAAVHAINGATSPNGVYFVCHITIDGTSGVNDTDFATPNATFNPVDASVSPLASAVVPAGTHTVTLLCRAVGGATPSATVADDALTAWAVSG